MSRNYDAYIRITYDLKKDKSFISTNIRPERVDDTLVAFLSTQAGQGEDKRKAKIRNIYKINLEIDLSDDTFRISDNTGNRGLREGIIMRTVGRWEM